MTIGKKCKQKNYRCIRVMRIEEKRKQNIMRIEGKIQKNKIQLGALQ